MVEPSDQCLASVACVACADSLPHLRRLLQASISLAAIEVAHKLHDLAIRGLPYIVAVDKIHKAEDGSDLILGYASLSPFRGHLVSYAPTVELSLFVHPDYHARSIGSELLKTLLELVGKGEVNHRCNGGPNQPIKFPTRVRNIIAVMAVDPDGKEGGIALKRWYIRRGFVESGRIVNVGFKRGRW